MIAPPVPEPSEILARDISPMPAGTGLDLQVLPLLQNLARAVAPRCVTLWLTAAAMDGTSSAHRPGWTVVPYCQAQAEPGREPHPGSEPRPEPERHPGSEVPDALRAGPARSIAELRARPGVRALAVLPGVGRSDEPPSGVIMIAGGDGGPEIALPEQLLSQTRDCVALLVRESWRNAVVWEQRARASRLAERLVQVDAELAGVRDVERARLTGSVLAGMTRRLGQVTGQWQGCVCAIREKPEQALGELREFRGAVDDLIDDFRTVVRAVHPAMLRSRGAVVALAELSAQLPREVRFVGDLGRRTGWEVESGLYHASAAALNALSAAGEGPLSVWFNRADGWLGVRMFDPSPGSVDQVRGSLADDARRMAALGGGISFAAERETGVIDLWLPERLSGAADDG